MESSSKSKDPFNINTETVTTLIKSFENKKEIHDSKEVSCVHNKTQAILRLPKTLFLAKILSYLEDNDIIVLTAVSSLIRRTIYSPLGFKILSRARSKQIVVHRASEDKSGEYNRDEASSSTSSSSHHHQQNTPQNFKSSTQQQDFSLAEKMAKAWRNMEGEDLIAELSTMKSVNDFLTQRVKDSEEKNEKLYKEIEGYKNQLRIQKQINTKGLNKVQILEAKVKNFENEVNDHKETIKDINMQYQKFVSAV